MREIKLMGNKTVKKTLICFMLCVILCSHNTNYAYAYIPLGVTGYGLYGNYEMQEKTNWCWVACAENINKWNGSAFRTQRDAVKEIKGNTLIPYPNVTGSINDTKRAAKYISNNTVSYVSSSNVLTYFGICDRIYNDQPVIAGGIKFMPEGLAAHMVLLTAWYTGNGTNRLSFFDPETGLYEDCIYEEICTGTSSANFMYLESVYMN